MSATFRQGCMGLPQELIDYIVDILHNDISTLKACSLTCKAMFASTRRLIHQGLCLPALEKLRILSRAKKSRPQGWDSSDAELRVLSHMTELGLLQYARQIHINLDYYSTLYTVPPHLHHLQFLNLKRVHTLSIGEYRATVWDKHFKTLSTHFHSTVTSLTLTRSTGRCRHILQFALQFPMLQDLCVERVWCVNSGGNSAVPTITHESPHLRGHLRLVNVDIVAMGFAHEFPKGVNFRSVELEEFSGDDARHLLNMCARTLQSLTVVPRGSGRHRFSSLSPGTIEPLAHFLATEYRAFHGLGFTEHTVLRRLTLRIAFLDVAISSSSPLLNVLSTITSPAFCEFIIELPPQVNRPAFHDPNGWEGIDQLCEERFATRKCFRLIIRTGRFYDQETF